MDIRVPIFNYKESMRFFDFKNTCDSQLHSSKNFKVSFNKTWDTVIVQLLMLVFSGNRKKKQQKHTFVNMPVSVTHSFFCKRKRRLGFPKEISFLGTIFALPY